MYSSNNRWSKHIKKKKHDRTKRIQKQIYNYSWKVENAFPYK